MNRMNLFGSKPVGKKGKGKLIHYKGKLGVFDYDPEEFEVLDYDEYLHYHGKGMSVNLPEGCISTSHMFENCKLPEVFSLGPDFDTSKVSDMSYMFWHCKLPADFSLGDKFDTSNVTDMTEMFSYCKYNSFNIYNYFAAWSIEEIIARLKTVGEY